MTIEAISKEAISVKHIVWDWNGTMLDDNDITTNAINAVAAGFGWNPITLEVCRATHSRPLEKWYESMFGQILDAQDWAKVQTIYFDAYRRQLASCGLTTGIPDFPRYWQESGGTQSLLSMWLHDELVPLVTQLGLAELFTRIDGLRDNKASGHKADYLVKHLADQQLNPADVVMIGDVIDDANAAAHAGTQCILVTTGLMRREDLQPAGVPIVDSIAEAYEFLAVKQAA